jgi:hypothetical protein
MIYTFLVRGIIDGQRFRVMFIILCVFVVIRDLHGFIFLWKNKRNDNAD